uniref:BRCT domain-containing protein n=1 Tax=Arcella intermedia TaxID=1963864 RepID=A0A6B2L559_9EUKA
MKDGQSLREALSLNGASIVDQPGEGVLYVHDSFQSDNELFSQLCTCGTRVISPKCIHESISHMKPLPAITHPLFARFMEGITICFENSQEMEEMRSLCLYMGGHTEDTLTDLSCYFITTKVGSIQYQLARYRTIPILSPEWVKECWRSEKLVPIKEYLLKPFAGCAVSVTGLSAATRNEIQRLIKEYGGEYTANLTKRCTHLISRMPQGIKYRYALEWGIHCVSVNWLFDSINAQVCADETQYFLPMSEATRHALFNPLFTSTRDFNRLSPALREKHISQLQRPSHSHSFRISSRDNLTIKVRKSDVKIVGRGPEIKDTPKPPPRTTKTPNFKFQVPLSKSTKIKLPDTQMKEPQNPRNTEDQYQLLQNLLDSCNKAIQHYQQIAQKPDTQDLLSLLSQPEEKKQIGNKEKTKSQ